MQRFTFFIAILLLSAFLLIGSVGVMAMTTHHHESGCPFMPGEMAICVMDVLDHIAAWQKAFTVTLPTVIAFLLLVGVFVVVWKYESPPDTFIRYLHFRKAAYSPAADPYQELFSGGVLNPKAP